MDLLKIALLAVVQGLTEFLPVSSSGHLVVVNAAFGEPLPDLLEVNIALHLGTLLSVLVFYRRRVLRLLGADRRAVPLLLVATAPAVVVGLAIRETPAKQLLEQPLLAGLMFPVTAALLIGAGRREPGPLDFTEMTWPRALLIGLFQAVAILPGISRSGATIAAGLLVGLKRESAATFAFLMAIPVIGGAAVLESLHLAGKPTTTPLWLLAAGAAVSFVVGLVALRLLTAIVQHGRLYWFAWWLIPLGIAVTVWQLLALTTSG
jgi:undecaprenyl-diphosphatase